MRRAIAISLFVLTFGFTALAQAGEYHNADPKLLYGEWMGAVCMPSGEGLAESPVFVQVNLSPKQLPMTNHDHEIVVGSSDKSLKLVGHVNFSIENLMLKGRLYPGSQMLLVNDDGKPLGTGHVLAGTIWSEDSGTAGKRDISVSSADMLEKFILIDPAIKPRVQREDNAVQISKIAFDSPTSLSGEMAVANTLQWIPILLRRERGTLAGFAAKNADICKGQTFDNGG